MPDKVALVRLRAQNSGYDSAMIKSKKLTEDLAATSTRFKDMSQKLDTVGRDLTRGVTLPLALAGAASFKLAKDFGTTFTQMATLAGVPVSELEGLKQSVLDLAGETGQAPQALAESLYQIYSSGVPASEAMNVLKASAQGAALGLGEASGVADALTSAMNTYGAGNLSAAAAADQLTAAVKAGKGEASQFAPQLGNLLPLANELGISFADTAGSLAFLTRGGNNAATASTKLEGVMRALVKPTQQGRDVLEQVGLSAEKLRQVVAEDGLPAALELLQEKFAGNTELMGKFFEDSEGYIGNLALMKNGGEEWSKVLQEVNDSQGLVAEGMAILQETPEFKAQQAMADLQASAVEVGTLLTPILATLAGGIADLASVFGSLPDPVQKGLIAIGLFAAALGPTISLLGNAANAVSFFTMLMQTKSLDSFRLGLMGLTQSGAGVTNAFGGMIAAAGGAGIVMGALGGAIGGAAVIMWDAKNKADNFADSMAAVRAEAEETGRTDLSVFADSVAKLWTAAEGGFDIGESDNAFRDAMENAGVGLEDFTDALNGTDAEWQAFVDRVVNANLAGGNTGPLIEDLKSLRSGQEQAAHTTEAVAAAQRQMESSTAAAADEMAGLTTETDKATDALATQADEILGLLDLQLGALDATDAYNQSIIDVAEAQEAEAEAAAAVEEAEGAAEDARYAAAEATAAIGDAEADLADARRDAEAAVRAVTDAEEDAAAAAADVVTATEDLAQAQREASGDSDEMRDALADVVKAEEALALAQADSLTAQQTLDDARSNYGDTLRGLSDDAAGAADDVLSAEIRLRDAQRALADLGKPDEDGNVKPVSADERLAAEIAVREAGRRLRDAQDEAAAAAADLERNTANGVEGSDDYIAALADVESTSDDVTEAQGNLAGAVNNVAQVQVDANQRVIDAQANLAGAINARADADQRVLDMKQSVVDANDRVRDAAAGVDRAVRDAAGANDAYRDAQAKVVAAKQATIDAHAEVEKKLKDVAREGLNAALAIWAVDNNSGNAKTGAENLAGKLRELAGTMKPGEPLRKYLEDTAAELDGIAGEYDVTLNLTAFEDSSFAALVSLGPARPGAANAERRARGGPVKAGQTYWVGEEGPELWTAPGDGMIVPALQSQAIAAGEFGGWSPADSGGMTAAMIRMLADARNASKSVTVHAPVDARGITNPHALSTVMAARFGYELSLVDA